MMKNTLQTTNGEQTLASLVESHPNGLILYFYPKDMTSGCTKQAEAFRDHIEWFNQQGVGIVGVSRDSLSRHKRFIEKHALNFPLVADTDEALCEAFSVITEKSMYGRKYMGIVRSTFWLSPSLEILHEWRGVKIPGHIEAIQNHIKNAE